MMKTRVMADMMLKMVTMMIVIELECTDSSTGVEPEIISMPLLFL